MKTFMKEQKFSNVHVLDVTKQDFNEIVLYVVKRCPLCDKFRRLCLAFDYLSFGPRIAYMCESMSFCHTLLEVWRHRQD